MHASKPVIVCAFVGKYHSCVHFVCVVAHRPAKIGSRDYDAQSARAIASKAVVETALHAHTSFTYTSSDLRVQANVCRQFNAYTPTTYAPA